MDDCVPTHDDDHSDGVIVSFPTTDSSEGSTVIIYNNTHRLNTEHNIIITTNQEFNNSSNKEDNNDIITKDINASVNEDEKIVDDERNNDIIDKENNYTVTNNNKKLYNTLKAFANSQYRTKEDNIAEPLELIENTLLYSYGITSAEADKLLLVHGRNELPEKTVPKWYIFISQLWQPMPIMIWLAAIVEAGIQNWIDMSLLLAIQFANASIGYYEITKAGDAVAALKKSLKPTATVKRDGKFTNMDAALVVPGDLVLLASGSAVPADCRVNEGEIEVGEAALTGESLPVSKYAGSSCKMGSTVVRGEVEATVEYTGANTFFGKTAALLGVS